MLSRLAPAKINWSLEIIGKRADGFHELKSLFVPIGLCDNLSASEAIQQQASLRVCGPQSEGVPTHEGNLICRAELLWRQAGGQAPLLDWVLTKLIPHGAGLGGGSSDAAAALLLLQEFATRALSQTSLTQVAAQLGSDVPFFLNPTAAELRGGRGEQVLSRAKIPQPGAFLVLAAPGFGCPTPLVYQAVGAPLIGHNSLQGSTHSHSQEPSGFRCPSEPQPNALEAAAHSAFPALADFASAIQRHALFHLSGSGSCYFSVCLNFESAQKLASKVRSISHYCQISSMGPSHSCP